MNHRLISDLHSRVNGWFDTMLDDEARLRRYQRDLLALRQRSPRPHYTVALTLRQCANARKMARHAASSLAGCRASLKALVGCNP